MGFIKYQHHMVDVWVREDLKGKHRENCLCYSCERFKPDERLNNCSIANALYENCVKHQVTTPVWECMHFREQRDS